MWAEVDPNVAPGFAAPNKDLALALDLNLGFRKARNVPYKRTSLPLTCFAVTHTDHQRFTLCGCVQRSARALSNPFHEPHP